ncbi:MAG: hypothetical protein MUF25_24815 [Pirellulaceae bacterium]|jgi:hypothetical protein|nr:hypothetical protein [Pirellulaceae bacterium]
MNRERLVQLLKAGSPLVTLVTVAPLIVVILWLTACVKHPVGDPEKSQVEPAYSGAWLEKKTDGARSLLILRPYDARTYLGNIFTYGKEGEAFRPQQRINCKAWLTSIGGATFLTMEPMNAEHFLGVGEKPPYLVAKLSLSDGVLQLRLVDGGNEAVKNANDSQALEKAIEQGVNTETLYGGEPAAFAKTEDKALLRSILAAFRPEGCMEW